MAADLAREGLPAAAADAATAALLADAVCAAAALTARVNLAALTDRRAAKDLLTEADATTKDARAAAQRAVQHAEPRA